jgi:hypothetical protein
MTEPSDNDGLDIAGFGKIAKAIPPKVYERSATALLTAFQQITAPITETTSGLGRYLRQKFDNMVEAEKAIATYTVESAIVKAKARAQAAGQEIHPPESSKSFVKAIEEASKETDPLLHEMWANLIASQLSDNICHPHFVEVLSHFSPSEANLLIALVPLAEVGENDGGYFSAPDDAFRFWIPKAGEEPRPWSISCVLLQDFRFADIVSPKGSKPDDTAILYRTALGAAFLAAVSASRKE